MRRHTNFSASCLFHPGLNGKILTQTNWFYSYQCNEPIFKVDKWGKTHEKSLQTFIVFAKNCASPSQLLSVIFVPFGSEREDFPTQTDWFYSYQCNEPIIKVDKWGKSYKKSLQTFLAFSKNRASPCQFFSVIFVLSSSVCCRVMAGQSLPWKGKLCLFWKVLN